ncbi:ATPases involved in chromosome partitioning [Candidatus Bipolaricaulis anaerobius]|jgi:Mrp family chromosome partitioning ATPase|uniref:Iron-sulfur cluster carrier protein n=1 Tax=Candidatus Bipolaricaulis anaerobius TaxID=2026885 RepID=A0A2X3KZ93_9BACT|nr:Mrp/NBP35 family ATP-binding protein [Candidatus Bipolaricaulis anaerobius]SQD92826.1 ATPases involved in chromosome partitioning [Candidatus Bipolaricaulis anaerobius]HQM38492.1 Mrp/NBP35 family ATP-binding protein [Candidatus Bipolaricaulis anaerobius]
MNKPQHVLMVLSGKGGVGKSTVAVNVAVALAHRMQVGLLDADLHGPNVPKMLAIEDRPMPIRDGKLYPVVTPHNLAVASIAFALPTRDAPVIWRGPLKMKAIQQLLEEVEWGPLDLLVADLPPGTGDEALSVAQLVGKAATAVVVTTPQDVALLDAGKAVTFARKVGVDRIGVVENMASLVCPHCGGEIDLYGTGGGERLAREMDVPFLGRIPLIPEVVRGGDTGQPAVLVPSIREPFLAVADAIWSLVIGAPQTGAIGTRQGPSTGRARRKNRGEQESPQ